MRAVVRIAATFILLGSGCATDDGTASEPAGLEGITAQHNRVRAEVAVPAITWEPELAEIAAAWLSRCVDENGDGFLDHDADSAGNYPLSVGENLYGGTGPVTGVGAAVAWEREEAFFTYPDECEPGQVCGHYTQMVWRDSTQLGCAIGECAGHRFGHVVVCNYAPAGNWGGQAPY